MAGASSSRGQISGTGPLKKKAKVSEPIDLTDQSSEPESEPTPSPSPVKKSPPPAKKPQPSQTPTKESQIPSSMTPEVVIQTPHEASYGALADSQGFFLSPRGIGLLSVHDHQPGLGSYSHPFYHRRTPWISEGYFFGPHHLIMVALLYLEEKVHRKKLLRADAIPLLFPRLLCQILEHLGYPAEPRHEHRRICREIFTPDRWTSMTAYGADQGAPARPEHPEEPVEIPVDTSPPAPTVAPTEHIPEVAPSTPQATPQTPPVIPPTLEPSPSAEPRITIPIIEYKGLCHTFQALATSQSILTQQMTALRAHQEQIIATQTQHTTILRQIQHHLGIISAPEHAIPSPPEPSQAPPFVDQPMPPEEPTTEEAEPIEPSSPHHPPNTI
uniref:Uncharacterized protein n=1 Tax=Vitis vinifera TaxID=29760 RepID=A5AGN3_VITVI|nr:hypothetical protein VITISV_024008 [Vitis vinifera]